LQPVIWRDGAIETMLDLPEVGTSFATRINASGLVGGTAERLLELSDGSMMFRFFPALWTNGALEMLELPEGLAIPEAPDDPMPNVTVHGLSDDGLLLARIGMTSSTGESASPPGTYIYDRGAWTALPSPSDDHPVVFAYGISPTGIVVGYVTTAEFEETRHVVWTDGSPRDVTDSITGLGDVRLGSLRAVNSSGQILATGSSDAGFHGLVLTPE
jgi:hypothetical protein